MKWLLAYFTLFGINVTFWTLVGIVRFFKESGSKTITSLLRKTANTLDVTNRLRFLVVFFEKNYNKQSFLERKYDAIVAIGMPSVRTVQYLKINFASNFGSSRVVNIDSHNGNQRYGEVNIVKPGQSLCGSLYNLLLEKKRPFQFSKFENGNTTADESVLRDNQDFHISKIDIDRDIATYLAGGILKHNHYLSEKFVTDEDFIILKNLMEYKPDLKEVVQSDYHGLEALDKTQEVIKKIKAVKIREIKKTRAEEKEMHRVFRVINNAKRIALVVENNSDWDTLGSLCSFLGFLKNLDKEIEIVMPTDLRKVPSMYYRGLFGDSTDPKKRYIKLDASLTSFENPGLNIDPIYGIRPFEVASITSAHNEEKTIAKTLRSLQKILPAENIFVVSDASTDKTAEIVRSYKSNVIDVNPNRGKAGALEYGLTYFDLYNRFKAVMIVDADSEVSPLYLDYALPGFNEPETAAVAVHAKSSWQSHWPPKKSLFFAAYRIRFYRVLQAFLRYGQTWKLTNVTTIIPGFASIYRTSVLKQIDIAAPGLVIEDYNMTFEVQHKKLGKIAYIPGAYGVSADPLSLKDYIKQVKRWNLGFWQTVKQHGFWPSLFSLSLFFYIVEILVFGLFFLTLPILLIWFFLHDFSPITIPVFENLPILSVLTIWDLLIGVFLVDYLMTIIVAIKEEKPILLLYGIGFSFLRYIDTFLILYTLPLAFIVKSTGKWKSPRRI